MKRHSFLFAGLIAGAVALDVVASAGAASLITNGSFESFDSSKIGANGYATVNTGAITGWTGAQSDGFVRTGINGNGQSGGANQNSQTFANNGVIPDGSYVAFLQAPDAGPAYTSLSQSITGLVDGQAYTLTFYANARAQFNVGAVSVATSFGAHQLSSTLDPPVEAGGSFTTPYHFVSVDFTYDTSWGSTLTFTSSFTGAGDEGSVVLDNVSLVAVPEPQTWALAGLGVSAVFFRLRRKQRNA